MDACAHGRVRVGAAAGFMAYNVLAGGVLTGKYLQRPAAVDSRTREEAIEALTNPRGRMDTRGWGSTLYRYRSGPADEATRSYAALAKRYGLSLTEMSLRWARERAAVSAYPRALATQTRLSRSASHVPRAWPDGPTRAFVCVCVCVWIAATRRLRDHLCDHAAR